ncbi:MAG: hypothetical protein WC247_16095 [Porticoccaceae bacterium]
MPIALSQVGSSSAGSSSGPGSPRKARGAAAIEFSLVFILLFVVFYGIAGYTVPLLLGISYEELAAEALREAVRVRHLSTDADPLAEVQAIISDSWLPAAWAQPCADYPDGYLKIAGDVWSLCLGHGNPESIIPPFTLFDWQVPRLPDEIRGEASIRLQ